MVHRIQPRPHSRARYFLRSWLYYSFLLVFFSLALEWILDGPREGEFGETLVVMVALAALCAWLTTRSWERYNWFSREPGECFLTMVESGLLIESPGKGMSFYLPWQGLSYRHSGDMLLISTHGALRTILSVSGLPREKRAAILSGLRTHSGQQRARHGLFSPQYAAAPYASRVQKDALPPVPSLPVPPPTPIQATSPALFTNTATQWREYLRFALRPRLLTYGVFLLIIAGLGFTGGLAGWVEEWESACFLLLFGGLITCKLVFPSRKQRSVPGAFHIALTETEVLERWDDGSWARFRLPEAEQAHLVRLPHSWCLVRRQELGDFLFDAEQPLPPQLATYRREPAPGNALRGLLATGVLLLGAALGYCGMDVLEREPLVDKAAFSFLLAQPDEAALRTFVEEYITNDPLCDVPKLETRPTPDGQGIAGYTLSFVTGASNSEEDEDDPHFAWSMHVLFSAEGEIVDVEGAPVHWCPCIECHSLRMERMMEACD